MNSTCDSNFGFPSEDRPYAPCILGNGTDLVPVDFTGSQSFHTAIDGLFPFWFKQERGGRRQQPLFRARYVVLAEREVMDLARSTQRFDPERAILYTHAQFAGLELEIESFLTDEHMLVEHYRFVRMEVNECQLAFVIDRLGYPDTYMVVPELAEPVVYQADDQEIRFTYRHGGLSAVRGAGCMGVSLENGRDHLETKAVADYKIHKKTDAGPNGLIFVGGIRAGDAFTRYLSLWDNLDNEQYTRRCRESVREARSRGYAAVREAHTAKWDAYSGASDIRIEGAEDLCELHRYNLYLFRAAQHPKGPIPTAVPIGHGTRYFWDHWFCQSAQLRANHLDEALRIARFYLHNLPVARSYAEEHGVAGAYFPWATQTDGTGSHTGQIHNHAVITFMCWDCYRFSGDKKILRELYPVMFQAMTYLLKNVVRERNGRLCVGPVRALDESDYFRENPSWTTAAILKGLEVLRDAASVLEEELDTSYTSLIPELRRILEANYEDDLLYFDPRKHEVAHGSILPFLMHFDLPGVDPTLEAAARGPDGLIPSRFGKAASMRIFPWLDGWAAQIRSLRGDAGTLEHLRILARQANCFGGIPEVVWLPGNRVRENYLGTHGCFSHALGNLMGYARDGVVHLLPHIPEQWGNIEVKNLRLEGGLLMSFTAKAGSIDSLVIHNESPESASFRVQSEPLRLQTDSMTLAPGQSIEPVLPPLQKEKRKKTL